MTTCIGPPQVGQQATNGAGGSIRVGLQSTRWAGTIIRRRVSGGMAQRAGIQPKCRTFMKPAGRTCGRNLRRNSMASRVVVRRRALPGVREVKGTVRSVSETRRRWEIATVKTYGARYVRAEWACGGAWLWTFQGIV